MPDVIKHFKNTVSKHTDAPEEFIEAAGYHLVSCTIGRHFIIPNARGVSKTRPNLWFLLSSIPGRFRRSTVQNYHNTAYENAVVEYRTSEKNDTKAEAKEHVQMTFLESGSPEGITDHIQDFDSDCFVIMSHEYGGILNGLRSKTYQAGVRDLLSKLYYGQGGYSYFSTKGQGKSRRFVPPNLYTTMFTGLQDPREYITEDLFKQGLMRRIIMVRLEMDDEKKEKMKENWKPYITDSGKHGGSEVKKLGKSIGKLMSRLQKKRVKMKSRRREKGFKYPHLHIDYMTDAREAINDYSKQFDDAIVDETDLQNMYLQSQGEKLDKLSGVSALSRGNIKKVSGESVVHIEGKDVDRARDFLERITKGWVEIIPEIGTRRIPTSTITDPSEKIVQVVDKNNGVINRTDFLRKVNMLKDDAKPICETLIERGEIYVAKDNGAKRGRKPLYFSTDKEKLKDKLEAPTSEDVSSDYDGRVATLLAKDDAYRLDDLW